MPKDGEELRKFGQKKECNTFDLIEKLTRSQISAMVNNMINFDYWWNKIYKMKTRFPYEFNFDERTTQDLSFYGNKSRIYGSYLTEIGFLPYDS